jgi:hypothetical protein
MANETKPDTAKAVDDPKTKPVAPVDDKKATQPPPVDERTKQIWLQVVNLRFEAENVWVQVQGDRAEKEPVWWLVDLEATKYEAADLRRAILDGLDKKRTVLVALSPKAGAGLQGTVVRIQFADALGR